MKHLRMFVMVVLLCAALVAPASLAFARSGDGLDSSGLVHWLASAAEGNMGGWETLYTHAQSRLRTTNPEVAREVQDVVTRAAFAGAITPCTNEFLGHRVQEDLERISLRLVGKETGVVTPAVCEVETGADAIEIYGYNFDKADGPIQVYVTHSSGIKSFQPYLRAENFATLKVTLPSNRASICDLQDAVLMVAWNGTQLARTPVEFEACATALSVNAVESVPTAAIELATEAGTSRYHWQGYWDSGEPAPELKAGSDPVGAAADESYPVYGPNPKLDKVLTDLATEADSAAMNRSEAYPVYGPNPKLDAVLLEMRQKHVEATTTYPVWSAEGGLDDLLTEMANMRAAGLAAQNSLDAKVEAMQR